MIPKHLGNQIRMREDGHWALKIHPHSLQNKDHLVSRLCKDLLDTPLGVLPLSTNADRHSPGLLVIAFPNMAVQCTVLTLQVQLLNTGLMVYKYNIYIYY